ncbi:MAG: hypothetical protein ACJ8FS_04415 [Sphingomicrobium sp.]
MRRSLLAMGVAGLVASCGQSSDNVPAKQAAAQPKKKPAYCFFKDEETKGWKASRDKQGNITVKGKAHVKDPRYKAVLGTPTISGTSAQIAPSISQNDTGYAALDDWWELNATIPDSAAITTVTVDCGAKTLAELKVPAKD